MGKKQDAKLMKERHEENQFYHRVWNIFATSKKYIVEYISKDSVKVTNEKGFELILNESMIMHIEMQPRLVFIMMEHMEITFYTYRDILVIM